MELIFNRRRRGTRKGDAVIIMILGIVFLASAILNTYKYYISAIDYNLLTSSNVVMEKIVTGEIDEYIGKFSNTTYAGESYLLPLDNGNYVYFKTDDSRQIAEIDSLGKGSEKVKFAGEIERLTDSEKRKMLTILTDQGLTIEEAEERLIPWSVVNTNPDIAKYLYMLALLFCAIGFLMLLPEFGDFVARTGVKREAGEPDDCIPASNYGYNSAYLGDSKFYADSNRNEGYTGGRYNAQNQNKSYIGSQYINQNKNRD